MDTAVRAVVPKCKLIPSIITVAFINLNSRVKFRVHTNVDGLTNELTESWIPISCHAKSRCDNKASSENFLYAMSCKNGP